MYVLNFDNRTLKFWRSLKIVLRYQFNNGIIHQFPRNSYGMDIFVFPVNLLSTKTDVWCHSMHFPFEYHMMTSSNGNIFSVTRPLWGAPVNSPHKGQWRGALVFSLICAWGNGWANLRDAGDLRRNLAHYAVTVMQDVQLSYGHVKEALVQGIQYLRLDWSVQYSPWWDLPFALLLFTHLPLDKMAAILADDNFKCIFLNEKKWLPVPLLVCPSESHKML